LHYFVMKILFCRFERLGDLREYYQKYLSIIQSQTIHVGCLPCPNGD